MKEKRAFVRLNAHIEVHWKKIAEKTSPGVKNTVSKNISEGGICIITQGKELSINDVLDIALTLPTKKVITLQGKVVWMSKFEIVGGRCEKNYDVGVKFVRINEKDKKEIQKFVFTSLKNKVAKKEEV